MTTERKHMRRFSHILFTLFISALISPKFSLAGTTAAKITPDEIGAILPLWSVLPFVGILLSIALFPLFAPKFWHHHFPKVSAFWALVMAIPFIILLWSLFVVSGGIYVRGSLKGIPAVNTILLLIGTLLASLIGTTGASMLLIRPVLRSNSWRKYKVHTICLFYLPHQQHRRGARISDQIGRQTGSLFLGVGISVELSGQCPDLFDILQQRPR